MLCIMVLFPLHPGIKTSQEKPINAQRQYNNYYDNDDNSNNSSFSSLWKVPPPFRIKCNKQTWTFLFTIFATTSWTKLVLHLNKFGRSYGNIHHLAEHNLRAFAFRRHNTLEQNQVLGVSSKKYQSSGKVTCMYIFLSVWVALTTTGLGQTQRHLPSSWTFGTILSMEDFS